MTCIRLSPIFSAAFAVVLSLPGDGLLAQTTKYDPGQYLTSQRVQRTYDLVHGVFSKIEPSAKRPVALADARRILTSAVLSAMAERCRLPWDRSIYLPMMAHYRHVVKLSETQMTLLGMVHGVEQGAVLGELGGEPCAPEIRDQLSKAMSKPP
jgi:hypothetical protein